MRPVLLAVVALSACGLPNESEDPGTSAADPIQAVVVKQLPRLNAEVARPQLGTLTAIEATPVRTVIRLEQRSGVSTTGLGFAPKVAIVEQASAAILVSSFDCGARGRWVDLYAGEGFSFCARSGAYPEEASCDWANTIPIGGSDADGTGLAFLVRRGEQIVGRFQVVEVTPTPFEWYETEAPFDVVVDAWAQ
ncbi:MAG: hypothetical protein JNM17_16845 [Archangium sp.]|nr:hypothetical protein [Archangium sp.]